jgi:Fibronectin type III domain
MEGRLLLSTLRSAKHSHSVARPTAPTFQATATITQVNLTWNAVRGATSYIVDEYTTRGWKLVGNTSARTFAVTGLTPATSYWFDVAARNKLGGTWGTLKYATTLPPIPAAPTLSASPVSSSQANLSWTTVRGATSYAVDEETASGWTGIASTSATSFVVAGLAPATSYTFDVGARNASGTTWATPMNVTLPVPTILPPTQASETTTTTTTQGDLGLVNIYPDVGTGWSSTWTSPLSSWIEARLGQQVGNGQCADLVNQALVNNKYETFYQTGGPTGENDNYVWGNLVATITPANCKSIASELFQSDVILQFSNVTFQTTVKNTDGSYTTTYDNSTHHTAVVTGTGGYSYSNGRGDWYVSVYEQNANNVQKVTTGRYYIPDMTGGTIWVYQPIKL